MSEARALIATERCRKLVAQPESQGLKPRPGLEPLDVAVKFNRPAAHTRSAFQVMVQMKLSMDGSGNPPFTNAAGLVAEGKTEAECLEVFYNWMADETAVLRFVEVVKAAELDALASQAQAETKAAQEVITTKTREVTHTWFEKKFDHIGRKLGLIDKKVQS